MPWKIVNLDYDCDRPHLHMRDPKLPIHMRVFLDGEKLVEVGIGSEDPDRCHLRAYVYPEDVLVQATHFTLEDLSVLISILASLDVEAETRLGAIAWTNHKTGNGNGVFPGNISAFTKPVASWPQDLTDEALVELLGDLERVPMVRRKVVLAEAARRGIRITRRGVRISTEEG